MPKKREAIAAYAACRTAVATALEVARGIENGVVVTILCDGADKYLSERFWED